MTHGRNWPGRAKAEFKLAAVNLSSEAGRRRKFRADHQGPVVAGTANSPQRPAAVIDPAGAERPVFALASSPCRPISDIRGAEFVAPKRPVGIHARAPKVSLGAGLGIMLTLRSSAAVLKKLVVDYALHHMKAKADGWLRPKVFRGWQPELPAHGEATLARRHSLRPVTTRRCHAGWHELGV